MNNQVNHIASKLSCALLSGVSMLALGLAAPAMAQETMETVVVTSQRAAIESAIKIKENADQIVDSIVADDAGKLPDRSITEVLQRVSGVTITHFNNLGSPDKYTVEGSGPSVRGLPGGSSTINGHTAFSASGGRSILWSDVPSELMAGVDIYKTYTPDQIEGGLGGTIALRTHLPFDFDGTKIGGRVGFSYGDLIQQGLPVASVMGSTRFDTKWGEMGLLVSLSYDDNSYRSDSIQTEIYFPHTNVVDNYTLDMSTPTPTPVLTGNKTYWIPGGFDYHTAYGYHQRGGANIAFQWRPSDKLLIHARAFSSVNDTKTRSYNYAASGGSEWANITFVPDPSGAIGSTAGKAQLIGILSSPAPTPSDPLYHVFNANNYLLLSNTLMNPQLKDSCYQPNNVCSGASTRTQADADFSRTTDIELGADWQPNDNWQVHANADFIYSKDSYKTLMVEGDAVMPSYGVDLSGNYPKFIFSDITTLRTGSNYYWGNTMPDVKKNYGQEIQANVDVTYHLNRGIFKDIKFGWRGDVRTERDRETGYDWHVLSADWNPPQYYWSDSKSAADTKLFQFPNFFRGEANLPGPALFVDAAKVAMLSDTYFQNRYNCQYDGDVAHCPNQQSYASKTFQQDGSDAKKYKTVNIAAYAMATFAKDDVFGMPLSGNFGARLVYVDNGATAHYTPSGNNTFVLERGTPGVGGNPGVQPPTWATNLQSAPIAGDQVSWTLLPAFNVQIMPTDQIHVRLAGSVTAQQPNFGSIGANYSVSTQTINNPAWHATLNPNGAKTLNLLTGWNLEGDNPRIKPEIGRNLDLSFEWYGQGADAHLSLFYKSIKHKVVSSLTMQNLPWNIGMPDLTNPTDTSCPTTPCTFATNGSQTVIEPTAVRSNINSDKESVIRGFEFGFTKYFDWGFVPSYLKGFGVAGNYTYIDSRAPGAYSLDMFGTNIAKRLPIENLSHHSINAQLMYDRDPISFRLAYNWRSKYLLMASGWDSHGSYQGANVGVTCHLNNTVAAGVGGNVQDGYCYYALPVWSKSFGSLDAGMDYSIDDNWKISIQSQNLLNTKAKTTMGLNMPAYVDGTGVARPAQREMPRNWFTADRRVSIDLRVNF